VGAVVQFSCDRGHSLEQGPPVIECINSRDPYWNDTEPICKGNGSIGWEWGYWATIQKEKVKIQLNSAVAQEVRAVVW